MILSSARGLALARIGFGLYFIGQAYDKTEKHWLSSGDPMTKFIQGNLPHAAHGYKSFLNGTVLPNAGTFAQMVTIGEWVAGILLVLGLFTRVGAIVAMLLTTNYMLCKGLTQIGGSVDRLFFLTSIIFILASAGLVWGLDGVLQNRTARIPVLQWFTGGAEGRRSAAYGD